MLQHIVCMKFKPSVTAEDIEALRAGLSRLPGIIPEIQGYSFGEDVLHSERSYDFCLVSTFADLDAMKRYQVHPDHVLVSQRVRALSDSVVVVDFNG